jgi:hypothetical protein
VRDRGFESRSLRQRVGSEFRAKWLEKAT